MDKMILQANDLFKNCGFPYYICGGFALDLFAGKELRPHSDLDISLFQENKRDIVELLQKDGFAVYKRVFEQAGPGGLTPIADKNDNKLDKVWSIWAMKDGCHIALKPREGEADFFEFELISDVQSGFNFVEIVLDSRDNDDFVLRRDKSILRKMDKAISFSDCGVPYMSPEVVLFLKSPEVYTTHEFHANKTPGDFKAIVPLLSDESREWLMSALDIAYPDGYDWLNGLL